MRKDYAVIALSTIIVIAGVFGGYTVITKAQAKQALVSAKLAKQEAVKRAEQFEPAPKNECLTKSTPATHATTGAEYTFPTNCLPEGWQRKDSPQQPARPDNANPETTSGDDGAPVPPNSSTSGETPKALPSSSQQSNSVDTQSSPSYKPAPEPTPTEKAIAEARSYRAPRGSQCLQVETPARHKETGARYTFATSCIPDGWEPVRGGAA